MSDLLALTSASPGIAGPGLGRKMTSAWKKAEKFYSSDFFVISINKTDTKNMPNDISARGQSLIFYTTNWKNAYYPVIVEIIFWHYRAAGFLRLTVTKQKDIFIPSLWTSRRPLLMIKGSIRLRTLICAHISMSKKVDEQHHRMSKKVNKRACKFNAAKKIVAGTRDPGHRQFADNGKEGKFPDALHFTQSLKHCPFCFATTWTYGIKYRIIGDTDTTDLVIRFDSQNIVASYSFNTTEHMQ